MRTDQSYGLTRKKKRLGDMLVESGVITTKQLEKALLIQKGKKQKLGETLVDLGYITEDVIAQTLKEQLKIDKVDLSAVKIEDKILKLTGEKILRKFNVMPYEFKQENPNILRLAMVDPMDIVAIDEISIITGFQIEPVIATEREIAYAIDRYYGNAEAMAVAQQYVRERQELYGTKGLAADSLEVDNSPIVLIVKQMIEKAVRQRASDIHIEPLEKQVRIRYRIDGVLTEVMRYDLDVLTAMVARIKIVGDMDISEKRKPQDGRMTILVDRQEFDIRVSILPTVYGEKIVMRLTSKKGLTKNKKELGFSSEEMDKFDRILGRPYGLILVTGPTGSGKSTTLYTALSELNSENVNIITVEDPVEANIDGINQVQVNTKAELTFSSALRSILRQDPDIIMIGEIRDSETAEIAVKASITGHLVVSTLHTNSAASTITRLADMGVEPYLIADAAIGVIAQRLMRRLCPVCRQAVEASEEEKTLLGVSKTETIRIYEEKGCNSCAHTGYYGRIGVYEIMPVTKELKKIISSGSTADVILREAVAQGLHTLRMSAAENVIEGITSISEMKKLLVDD